MQSPKISEIPKLGVPYLFESKPKKESEKLTTVAGVRGKDGIVIISDTQETSEETRRSVVKIDPIGDDCVFAGATNDTNFLFEFEDQFLKPALATESSLDIKSRLDRAIHLYDDWLDSQYGNSSQRRFEEMYARSQIQGVFGTRYGEQGEPSRFKLFEINNHSLAQRRIKSSVSATAGTGGRYARLLFESAKGILDKIPMSWDNFSVKFLAQFCYVFIGKVIYYDSHSSGLSIWRLTEDQSSLIGEDEIFGPKETLKKKDSDEYRYRLSILLENFINDIGRGNLLKLLVTYDIPELIDKKIKNKQLAEQITSFLLKELSE